MKQKNSGKIYNKPSFLLTALISIYPILVVGNINQAPESSQSNITQKTQKLPVSESKASNQRQESKTLIVKTALKYFVLTYSKNRVAIKGHQLDLSLDRKKCNTHIIDRFNKEISQIINDIFKKKELQTAVKKKEINTVEISMEGKSYFTKFSSRVGQTFLYFPKEILRMKWEEKFNCQKEKKPSTNTEEN
ncbi:MAG: hypothetical protein OXM55_06415 [Bdellovibrionales bacterium]|nr:hypothetical protein [Bdellovibrionales bacterium]